MNQAVRLVNYIKSSQQELKKVVWPTRKEVIRDTILVIAFSVIIAFFLGAVDYILTIVVEKLIG
jgi:preprotein translocase subunit SecE